MAVRKIVIIVVAMVILSIVGFLVWRAQNPPLKELFREFASMLNEKKNDYDVTEAWYCALSAYYYYKSGDAGKARELISEALRLLRSSELLPPPPREEWGVTESNVWISRSPTTWDVVPVGAVFLRTGHDYLSYYRGDKWKLSCFIIVAVGRTRDGGLFFYQGRLPLTPREGAFRPRIYVHGKWMVPEIVFMGPIYVEEGDSVIKLYQSDLSGEYLQEVVYYEDKEKWVHRITRGGETVLEMEVRVEGPPMWLGEWNGSLLVHGVYPKLEDFDTWGGFWSFGSFEGYVKLGGEEAEVEGFFVFDRASHRPLYGRTGSFGGAPLSFSCMVIHQEGLVIMVAHSTNPSPRDPGVRFQHQLRITIGGESYATTDFELVDSGGLQPSWFRLYGRFEDGYFNLTGKAVLYWPEKWAAGRGTWWNSSAAYTWGRAVTVWSGEVVVGNRVIAVSALGVGEYTRCCGSVAGTCKYGGDCWGRWSGEEAVPGD